MILEKFTGRDKVVLRSTDADVEQKVFRYEAENQDFPLFAKGRGMDASAIGCTTGSMVSVRNDSDVYCDWLGSLTGD